MGFGPIPKEALEPTEDSPAQSATGNPPSAIGTVRYFGDYELLEQIGRGGMGVVFKARQISLRRLVALKMLGAGALASPTTVQRFHIEAEAAAKLDHPNIVPIYEIGVQEGQHYFSMKLVEGGNLEVALQKLNADSLTTEHSRASKVSSGLVSQYSVNAAALLIATIARAVHYAHQHGVIHRDLKPGNVLLDAKGEPHITDFGLAKILEHEIGVTRTAEVMGTPSYMSPEQAAGRQLSTATDIWSLGVILYELLTGRRPFRAENSPALLRRIAEEEPVPPSKCEDSLLLALRPSRLWLDLEVICLKCLEKDPSRRYASAAALADDLEHWLHDEPIHARPVSSVEKVSRWCRRKPHIASLSSAVVLVSIFGVVGWIWARDRSRAPDIAREKELKILYSSDLFLADRALKETNLLHAEEILRGLQEAIDRHPADSGLWQARGVMLQKTRALAPAYEHLSRAIELASTNSAKTVLNDALLRRSSLLRQMNRVAEAGVDYRHAKRLPYPRNLSPIELPDYQSASNVNVELGLTNCESGLYVVTGYDSKHAPAMVGDQGAWLFGHGWNYAYFFIDPTYKWTLGSNVVVRIEYRSLNGHKLGLHFDGDRGVYSVFDNVVSLPDSGTWQVDQFVLKGARFDNSQNGGADFRLWDNERGFYLRRVSVFGHNPLIGPQISHELRAREPDAKTKSDFEAARTPQQVAEILRSSNDFLLQQAFGDSNSLHVPVVLNVLEETIRRQLTNYVFALARAKVLTKLGRLDEALNGLSKVIDLTADTNSFPTMQREAFLQRSGLFFKMKRFQESGVDNCRARDFPLRDSRTSPEQLDLGAFYNGPISHFLGSEERETLNNFLQAVRQNTGVEFDARAYVALYGRGPIRDGFAPDPRLIQGIPVNRRFTQLHILHSASYGERTGTQIGSYILRFTDGQSEELPVVYGENVRSERGDSGQVTRATVGWSGQTRATAAGTKVTLFKVTWPNPRPTVEVKSLDFVSAMTESAPQLIAITVE